MLYDRRMNVSDLISDVYIFRASFADGLRADFQVHPEFGSQGAAERVARKYAIAVGQMPTVLRTRVSEVNVLMGMEPFAGSWDGRFILIHTGQALQYEREGILPEVLVHEACHVSLDGIHSRAPGWITAQEADGDFISIYAQDHPFREDIAESFLPYFAYRYRADRLSEEILKVIERVMPNRIAYFDAHLNEETANPPGE